MPLVPWVRSCVFELIDECGEMRGVGGREGVVLILESFRASLQLLLLWRFWRLTAGALVIGRL